MEEDAKRPRSPVEEHHLVHDPTNDILSLISINRLGPFHSVVQTNVLRPYNFKLDCRGVIPN